MTLTTSGPLRVCGTILSLVLLLLAVGCTTSVDPFPVGAEDGYLFGGTFRVDRADGARTSVLSVPPSQTSDDEAISPEWKPATHGVAADAALAQARTGRVEIPPYSTFPTAADVRAALATLGAGTFRNYYLAGVVGPDAFPDILFGQGIIHTESDGTSDAWLRHLWEAAHRWPAAGAFAGLTAAQKTERAKALAFTYGFLTHAAGDVFAHTFVNRWSGGVFPDVGAVAAGGAARTIALRHLAIETLVADKIGRPAGVTLAAPVDFIYATLVDNAAARALSGDGHLLFKTYLDLRDTLPGGAIDVPLVLQPFLGKAITLQAWKGRIDDGLKAYVKLHEALAKAFIEQGLVGQIAEAKKQYGTWVDKHLCRMTTGLDIDCSAFDFIDEALAALLRLPLPQAAIDALKAVQQQLALFKDGLVDWAFEEAFGLTPDQLKEEFEKVLKEEVETLFFPRFSIEMGLDPALDFAPYYNTITLSKLILMDAVGLNALLAKAGAGAPGAVPDNIMLGVAKSLDGDYQWRADSPHAVAPGFLFWRDETVREKVFFEIFMCGDTTIESVPSSYKPPLQKHLEVQPNNAADLKAKVAAAAAGDFVLVDGSTFHLDEALDVDKSIVLLGKLGDRRPEVRIESKDDRTAAFDVAKDEQATVTGFRLIRDELGFVPPDETEAHICNLRRVSDRLRLVECIGCFTYHPDRHFPPDRYPIVATFQNKGREPIVDMFFKVLRLDGPSCPCAVVDVHAGGNDTVFAADGVTHAAGHKGGAGFIIPPDPTFGGGEADGILSPGGAFTIRFDIELTKHEPQEFTFFVEVYGIPYGPAIP